MDFIHQQNNQYIWASKASRRTHFDLIFRCFLDRISRLFSDSKKILLYSQNDKNLDGFKELAKALQTLQATTPGRRSYRTVGRPTVPSTITVLSSSYSLIHLQNIIILIKTMVQFLFLDHKNMEIWSFRICKYFHFLTLLYSQFF